MLAVNINLFVTVVLLVVAQSQKKSKAAPKCRACEQPMKGSDTSLLQTVQGMRGACIIWIRHLRKEGILGGGFFSEGHIRIIQEVGDL
jgi:hypothetical protein